MQALEAPVLPGDDVSYNQGFIPHAVSPAGGLVAIRAGVAPYRPEIWIYRLPGTSPIAKIPLASSEAELRQATFEQQADPPGSRVLYSPPYATVLGPHSFRWSPNGRLLAYASASTGPDTDLFLFDSLATSWRQLTHEEGEVLVLGWSPSSTKILFATSHSVDLDTGFDAFQLSAFDLTTSSVIPLETLAPRGAAFFDMAILGWASNDEAIVYDTGYEGGPRDLRIVDVSDATTRVLRAGYALAPSFDPSTATVFFTLVTSAYLGSDPAEPDGLYSLSIPTAGLSALQLGERRFGTWLDHVQTLVTCDDSGPSFNNPGTPPRPVSGLQDVPPASCESFDWWPAPDGSKMVVTFNRGIPGLTEIRLLTPDGQPIASVIQPSGDYHAISWLPGSAAFLATTLDRGGRKGSLFLHSEERGWQAEKVPIEVTGATPIYVLFP